MNRFYACLFLECGEDEDREAQEKDASRLFEQWKNAHHLQETDPLHSENPALRMLGLAEKEGIAVCRIQFHHLDIIEIEWEQPPEQSLGDFWQTCLTELEKQTPAPVSYLGTASVLFADPDESLKSALTDKKRADISHIGTLYSMGQGHHYILFAEYKGLDPAKFLGWDFPIIASAFQKLEIEYEETRAVKDENEGHLRQISALFSAEHSKDTDLHFLDEEFCYSCLRYNTSKLGKIRQTLEINLLNLKYLKAYSIQNDGIFAPLLKQAEQHLKQTEADLSYARLTLEEIRSRLEVWKLKLENQRLKSQKRTELFTQIVFVIIMTGQLIIPLDLSLWERIGWMAGIPLFFFSILLFLDKWRNK